MLEFLKEFNVSVNTMCFLLFIFGGVLYLWQPDAGKSLILIAGGAFGGATLAKNASNQTVSSQTVSTTGQPPDALLVPIEESVNVPITLTGKKT